MPCVIEIQVVQTRGSAPRESGTRMWVSAAGAHGTIGGGRLEHAAIGIAREMLAAGEQRRERRFALGDSLGQCCGGAVSLAFTAVDEVSAEVPSRFALMLFGAGHVGREVVRIAGRLPCTVTWVDSRAECFEAAAANTRALVEDEPAWAVDAAPPGAYYLVMTHSHALDLEIVERVLRRGDFGFLGLIGSETKAAKFRARLAARGVDAARLVCPIGVFKAGKHPAEVAVSAVAQLLALAPDVEKTP
jgi:xanthine dehydrogenase accessory factor